MASFNQHHAPHWYDRFGYLGQIMVDDATHGYFSLVTHQRHHHISRSEAATHFFFHAAFDVVFQGPNPSK